MVCGRHWWLWGHIAECALLAAGPSSGYGPPPGITFDRFVRACVAVKTLTEAFQRQDTDRDGWVTVNYEDFMKVSRRDL